MENSPKYKWIVVGLLLIVALLNYMDRQMLATMKPTMQIDIAELQTASNFGRLMAIFLWIYAFMSPVAGMIADRINKKWLIIGSLFVWSVVTFSMSLATNFTQLYWLRALMGVSEALYMPAGLSLIVDFHSTKTRSLAVGIHLTGVYLGQAFGGFGATVASSFSWQTAFQSFGLIGMVYSIVLIFFLYNPFTNQDKFTSKNNLSKPHFSSLSILLSNISFWIILFYFAIPSLPGWAIKNWLPTLFSEKLGIDMATAGPLSTITTALSSLIGVIIGGMISDKWVQKSIKGRVYTGVCGLILTIPALVLVGFGTSLFHFLAAAILFGLGFGIFDTNNMPILCQFVDSKYRATAYGLMNFTGISAGALITDWLGKSTDKGNLARDFAFLAIVVLLTVIIQLTFLRPKVRDFVEE
jgi:MFS transporter, ACS family, D-galactonate transporter